MKPHEPEFDYVKADPSIRDQLIRTGLAAIAGFVAEALVKAAFDKFVLARRKEEFESD